MKTKFNFCEKSYAWVETKKIVYTLSVFWKNVVTCEEVDS